MTHRALIRSEAVRLQGTSRILAGLLLAAALAATGLSLSPADASQSIQQPGTLKVREKFDDRAGFYIEGYVSYLVVRRAASGAVVVKQNKPYLLRSSSILPRGVYRLRSYIRPCDGNCGLLGSPTNSCSVAFKVRAGDVVKARIHRDANGCRVSIGS